jgi:hypothetical protein
MDHIRRPKATVLSDSAVVPEQNLQPPPSRFTHEIIAEQPYYYIGPQQAAPPDGKLAAGTKVKLQSHDGGSFCQIVDARGLCVTTAFSGLKPLD